MFLLACTAVVDTAVESTDSAEVQVEGVGDAPAVALTMEPAGGTFTGSVELSLSLEGADVEVYYTLDGSEPNERDELYEGPFEVDGSVTVRARAVSPAREPVGPTVSQTYVRVGAELADFDSNLPLLVLSSDWNLPDEKRDSHTPFALQVFEPGEDGRTRLVGSADQDLRLGLKVRGSSSSSFPKHSYGVEIWGPDTDEDHDVSLLGMPAESDWVLLSPLVFDRALMRNALAYELSRDAGRYAPRTRFVELFAAGDGDTLDSPHYRGVYVLVERIKRGPERVDIASLSPDDQDEPAITGGYLFKEDRPASGESGFYAGTAGGAFTFQQPFIYVDPDEDSITGPQAAYLSGELNELAGALNASDFTNPQTGRHYSEIVDVDSFVDHHILNTYPKNPDAFRLSGYFHKDREGPLQAGPLWDFDRTMGCAGGETRPADPTWWDPSNQTEDTTFFFEHGFWLGFFRDPSFQAAWVSRWRELLAGPLALEQVLGQIEAWEEELDEAADRNFARWSDYPPRGDSFHGEVLLLEDWLTRRHAWISACLETSDPLACTGS